MGQQFISYLRERGFNARVREGVLEVEHHNCHFGWVKVDPIEGLTMDRVQQFADHTGIIPEIRIGW